MYYVWVYETFSDNEAKQLGRPRGSDQLAFDDGVPAKDNPHVLRFEMTRDERGELGDYVLTSLPGLIVSSKVRGLLEASGVDNVEYFPVEIVDQVSGASYKDYFVANVIGVVDCIDMRRSKLSMRAGFPDKIRDIDELHIDEARTHGFLMFRLARRSTLVLVHDKVKRALESAGLRGLGLTPAEGFST